MIFIVECNNDYSFFKKLRDFLKLNAVCDVLHCSDEVETGGYDGVIKTYCKRIKNNNKNKLIIAVFDYDNEQHFDKLAKKLKLHEDYNSCENDLMIIFKKKQNPKHQVWIVKPKAIESFVNEIYKEIKGTNYGKLKELKSEFKFEQVLEIIFTNFEKSQTLKNLKEIINRNLQLYNCPINSVK